MGSIYHSQESQPTTSETTTPNPPKIKNGHGRLAPQVIDQLALKDPSHLISMTAKSPSITSFHNLTVLQLSHAINHMSHHIDSLLGKAAPGTSPPIAYIGIQDFRYLIMKIASMKTSHPLLLPSTANALQNTLSLISVTDVKVLFYSGNEPMKTQALALRSLIPSLQIYKIPTWEQLLSAPGPSYPYTKTWEEAQNDKVLIVHTSGSTGNPKPIYYTHKFLSRLDAELLTPPIPGRKLANLTLLRPKKLQFSATPFFHLSGLIVSLTTVFMRTTMVIGPVGIPVSGKIVCEIAKRVRLSGLLCVPSLCDAIFSDYGEEIAPFLGELEHVLWFGGPLAKSTGDYITTHTKATLWQIYGSTEMGMVPLLVPSPKSHWQYLEFHPTIGPTLERQSPDSDVYELVYRRHEREEYAWSRPVFDIFPECGEWRSRDLFRKVENDGEGEEMGECWVYQGRVDDMMVMSNALKVNPLDVETKLQVHPVLKGCLVIGVGYTKCGLLVEPKDYAVGKEVLVESLWESVERANETVPEHARIDRRLVVVGTEDKPFVRAAKGTIVRKLTTGLYEKEIKEVYDSL